MHSYLCNFSIVDTTPSTEKRKGMSDANKNEEEKERKFLFRYILPTCAKLSAMESAACALTAANERQAGVCLRDLRDFSARRLNVEEVVYIAGKRERKERIARFVKYSDGVRFVNKSLGTHVRSSLFIPISLL